MPLQYLAFLESVPGRQAILESQCRSAKMISGEQLHKSVAGGPKAVALADNGGTYLVIEATEGQSNGVTRAHAKASGTMLAEVKWAAAAAGGGEP